MMEWDSLSRGWILQIEPGRIVFSSSNVEEPVFVVMNIGYQSLVEQVFLRHKPTPVEVEEAIIRIEDEIMREHAKIDSALPLVCHDQRVWEIAQQAGISGDESPAVKGALQRDAVEFLFNRWVDIVSGSPARASEKVMNKEFSARLLILRELLHHLNFKEVLLV